jgi:glucose-6-phosphate isomerase
MCHDLRVREDRLLNFNPGFDITVTSEPLGFEFGETSFGPQPELRLLDAIRPALRDPEADGPDPVYAIAMDVGKRSYRQELQQRMLLFGVVTYATGRLGQEVVRSQGHVHKISSHSGWVAPEIYEIWAGKAFIYMQEFAADHPGRCFAVEAEPGDIVVVPPGWAHTSMSADPNAHLTFGALCDREYGFHYEEIRRRRGVAWYALLNSADQIYWEPNPRYQKSDLVICKPGDYRAFGIERARPLYSQFEMDPSRFQWVSQPALVAELWKGFTP